MSAGGRHQLEGMRGRIAERIAASRVWANGRRRRRLRVRAVRSPSARTTWRPLAMRWRRHPARLVAPITVSVRPIIRCTLGPWISIRAVLAARRDAPAPGAGPARRGGPARGETRLARATARLVRMIVARRGPRPAGRPRDGAAPGTRLGGGPRGGVSTAWLPVRAGLDPASPGRLQDGVRGTFRPVPRARGAAASPTSRSVAGRPDRLAPDPAPLPRRLRFAVGRTAGGLLRFVDRRAPLIARRAAEPPGTRPHAGDAAGAAAVLGGLGANARTAAIRPAADGAPLVTASPLRTFVARRARLASPAGTPPPPGAAAPGMTPAVFAFSRPAPPAAAPSGDVARLQQTVTTHVVEEVRRNIDTLVSRKLRIGTEQVRRLSEAVNRDLDDRLILERERIGGTFGP